MGFSFYELLDAPCCFCGYNGPNYYQAHTHSKDCPWYEIGGGTEREHALVVFAKKGMLKVHNNAMHSDGESVAVMEGVDYLVNQVDAETISLTRRR